MYNKIYKSCITCLAIMLIFITGKCTINASEINNNPLMMKRCLVNAINVETGQAVISDLNKLNMEDQKVIELQSNDALQKKIEIVTDFYIEESLNTLSELNLEMTMKSTVNDVSMEIAIYNKATYGYDSINVLPVSGEYMNVQLPLELLSDIDNYVDNNTMKIKATYTYNESFNILIDYIAMDYTYCSNNINDNYFEYFMDNLIIEEGTITSNEMLDLNNRDNKCLEVSSSDNNKVAWHATKNMMIDNSVVNTLSIKYNGSYSIDCNNTWLSLWNYTTNNWQVIRNFKSSTENKTVEWSTSNEQHLADYISEYGDIKVRLYNSSSNSFIRSSDYLSVTVYYTTNNLVKHYTPDSITSDYGTINGSIQDISQSDNNYLIMDSDVANKVAWKCDTQIDVNKDYIKSLTLTTRVKVDTNDIRNQYFSLWDFVDNKWDVFCTRVGSDTFDNLNICIDDPLIIERVVSDTGLIKARLYNSSPSSFKRYTDIITYSIEYGNVGTFEFAQLSDVHELIGSDNFVSIINELNTEVNPDFTIITGDITDHGTNEQFDKYIQDASQINSPVYAVPGNHDVRWWNANGKKDWEEKIGELYYSFDYEGVHFLMLDSSSNFELDAKFNKQQLQWVVNDLEKISKDTPVLIFAHHPFKIHHNITGIDELLSKIEEYNVVGYLAGHLHYYGIKNDNNIPVSYITYIKDNTDQDYCTVKITPNYLYMYKRKASDGSKSLWFQLPMINKRKPEVEIVQAEAKSNGNVDVQVNVAKAPDGIIDVKVRIDSYGPWTLLTQNDTTFTGEIDISQYNPAVPYGKHFIVVYVTDNNGRVWKEYKDYEWTGGDVTTRWVFETGDMIQSTPTYHNNVVYVGSEDGFIYAIDDTNGSLKWKYNSGEAIISKPAIYEGVNETLVMVGSSDKRLYALNADTGAVKWYYETNGSILSDPLVDGDNVYFGSGDSYIYCVNIADGTLKWRYETNGLMRQRPVIHENTLYAFVRDTYIWYAINTEDGTLKWRGNADTDESMFVCGDVRPVITNDNKLWCIDAQNTKPGFINISTGALDWTSDSITQVSSRGMCTDGEVVYYTSGNGRQLHAINATDQSLVWYTDLRANNSDSDYESFQIDTGLIYDNSLIFHVAERGRITGINANTGSIEFIYDAVGYPEKALWSTPEVADGKIYVSGVDGNVYSIQY